MIEPLRAMQLRVNAMNIVIVGAGNVGRALGAGWRNRGHNVTMALRDTTGERAAALKQGFGIVPVKDAAPAGDILVLAVPWSALTVAAKELGSLAGKIVIDAT